jgi:anti-anti-sigma factor
MTSLSIHTRFTTAGAELRLRGQLTALEVPRLRVALNEALVQAAALRLDLADVRRIDSAGLELLLRAARAARQRCQPLTVGRLSGTLARQFRLTLMDTALPCEQRADLG